MHQTYFVNIIFGASLFDVISLSYYFRMLFFYFETVCEIIIPEKSIGTIIIKNSFTDEKWRPVTINKSHLFQQQAESKSEF